MKKLLFPLFLLTLTFSSAYADSPVQLTKGQSILACASEYSGSSAADMLNGVLLQGIQNQKLETSIMQEDGGSYISVEVDVPAPYTVSNFTMTGNSACVLVTKN